MFWESISFGGNSHSCLTLGSEESIPRPLSPFTPLFLLPVTGWRPSDTCCKCLSLPGGELTPMDLISFTPLSFIIWLKKPWVFFFGIDSGVLSRRLLHGDFIETLFLVSWLLIHQKFFDPLISFIFNPTVLLRIHPTCKKLKLWLAVGGRFSRQPSDNNIHTYWHESTKYCLRDKCTMRHKMMIHFLPTTKWND